MRCKKCGEEYKLNKGNTWWDESGYGYSAKLTKCPLCGSISYIKVIEDVGLDVNHDERFYEYERKDD